jgi:predicted PurR-regulated permease PerM
VELDLQRFYNINRRFLMWIVFFAILYLLRDFFSVMFLTFIIGFVMRKIARFVVASTRAPYWAAVVFPYLIALSLLVLLMMTTVPRVVDEGVEFSRKLPNLLHTLAEEVKKTAVHYNMESVLAKYVAGEETARHEPLTTAPATRPTLDSVSTEALVARLQDTMTGLIPRPNPDHRVTLPELFVGFVKAVAGGTIKFLLAVLLSFLIVLDYDKIANELVSWRESRVGRFFYEATASVINFSEVVGTAFQCQLIVALLNAVITCIGLAVLDIGPILLLTSIVFLFGLIPVLGVWISSVPIVLIAFNDHGVHRALLAVAMIVIVHLLEAYVFNPRIYAARFHLNPVIVLIILLVGHETFGVWGMLLGIPVTHYVLNVAQMPGLPPKLKGRRNKPVPAPRPSEG